MAEVAKKSGPSPQCFTQVKAQVVLDTFEDLKMSYPEVTTEHNLGL